MDGIAHPSPPGFPGKRPDGYVLPSTYLGGAGDRLSDGEMARRLDQHADESQGTESANTLASRASALIVFYRWAETAGEDARPPVPGDVIRRFLDAMASDAKKPRKPATLAAYSAHIDALHAALNLERPGRTNAVKMALKRARREKGVAQRQAPPLRWEALSTVLKTIEAGTPSLKAVRDAALLRLGYDTLARISELAALDANDIRPGEEDDMAHTVILRRSKTDQDGHGSIRFIRPETFDAVARWTNAAGIEGDEPLFSPLSSASHNPRLEGRAIYRMIRERCGHKYSGHSLRVGAAVDARAAGIDTGAIAQAGGWASTAMVNRYAAGVDAGESAMAKLAEMQASRPAY